PPPDGRDQNGSDQPPAASRITPRLLRDGAAADRKLATKRAGQSEETPRASGIPAAIPSAKSASIVPNVRAAAVGDARVGKRLTERASKAKAGSSAAVRPAAKASPRAALR